MKLLFNLQLFAASDYTNATTDVGLTAEMKTFYDTVLLKNALPNLVFQQFGLKQPLPQGNGKVVEWRKFGSLNKATTPLTEGVTPDGHKVSVSSITATVHQYGDYTVVTDVLELTAVDNFIAELTKIHSENAAATIDTITRNELLGTTNVMYAPKSNGTAVSARSSLDMTCILTPAVIAKAAAILKKKNTPTIDGSYVMAVHPDVELDLITNQNEWIDIQKYTDNVSKVFNGEIGSLYKFRFVRTSEAPILAPTDRSGADATKIAVFPCLGFGKGAYGVVDLQGGGLEMIIKSKGSAGTADPLDQRSSVGWKVTGYATKILNNDYMINVECVSSQFSKTELANDTPTASDLPSFS